MKKLKVVTIGGGSSYTPELIEDLIKRYERFPITELCLVDIKEGEKKLEITVALAIRMFKAANLDVKVWGTFDRKNALENANFVTTQFRVGQLEARAKDEKIPASHHMLGQETNGIGGLFKGLRTIPIVLDIVKEVEEICPDAFIINFTNPAGMVSEAVNRYTNFKKFLGVCNVPIHLKFEIADTLEVARDDFQIDFIGLNHMVFGTKAYINNVDKTKEVLKTYLEKNISMNNIAFLKWEDVFINELGLILCPYHRYYFQYDEMLKKQEIDFKNNEIRAEVVMKYEKELFKKYQDVNLVEKPKELEQRGGAYYSDVACELLSSLHSNENKVLVVNIKNNGHVKNIDYNDTIEISCTIDKNGATPLEHMTEMPKNVLGMYHLFKSYELLACEAAYEKSLDKGLLALNLSPFTRSDVVNKKMFDEMVIAHKKYLQNYKWERYDK
ncbi:MAG: 6-phospho-beta-glucosidase [Spiroplasma sp.]|nr:6-phospho-beta-glucosidase [Mycoplasmatales bacterium]